MRYIPLFPVGLVLAALGLVEGFTSVHFPWEVTAIIAVYWFLGGFFLAGDLFLLGMSCFIGDVDTQIHLEGEMMLPREAPRAFFGLFFTLLLLAMVIVEIAEWGLSHIKPRQTVA